MKTRQKEKKLTGKQMQYLRGLGHHVKPLVMLGREGITDNVINAASAVLRAHELLKVKIGNGCLLEKQEAADAVAAGTGGVIVGMIGRTFLVFRENPDRNEEERIRLPKQG